jgi:hypothetical protein
MEPEKLKTVYVAAFLDEFGETILIGFRDGIARATIEHQEGAVRSLIKMADSIVADEKAKGHDVSYRLLRFDKPIELDPELYRGAASFQWRVDKPNLVDKRETG